MDAAPGFGDLPVLYVHGEADELVPMALAQPAVQRLRGDDFTERVVPDARHEVFNELDQDVTIGLVADFVERRLDALGCQVVHDAPFVSAVVDENQLRTVVTLGDDQQLEASVVVNCFERLPAASRLGTRKLGLQFSPVDGGLMTDVMLETACRGVYAAGGVLTGAVPAEVARAQGIAVAERIAGVSGPPTTVARAWQPAITTIPMAAWAGLSEEDARATGREISVGVASLDENTAAMLRHVTDGFVKIVVDRSTGEILGVHAAGYGATELVASAAMAMRLECTVDDLAEQVAPMPSLAKSLEAAARAAGPRRGRRN